MKRIFLLIAGFLVICTLCSCTKPALSSEYKGEVTIRCEDETATAEVTSTDEGITILLTRPDSLNGLFYTFKDGELHTSLGQLECITEAAALPDDSPVRILITVLSGLDTATYRSTEDGVDAYLLSTPYGNLDLKATDGKPVSLTVGNVSYLFSAV